MLKRVREQRPTYNNNSRISSSSAISSLKLVYYQMFAVLYSIAGKCADKAIVNSSWTEGHIRQLWGSSKWLPNTVIAKVFPPCNVEHFSQVDISAVRQRSIVSVGQFRPEKDHMLQIR